METDKTPAGQSNMAQRMQQLAEQEQRIRERVAAIRHTILVISGKGGVGKSTIAANLAWALALRDLQTGLLDADIHGPSIPLMTGVRGQTTTGSADVIYPVPVNNSLKVMSIGFLLQDEQAPVIWRGPLRSNIIRQFIANVEWGTLDYLVVDLPPGTGDEPLTVAQSFPHADGAVVVTTPQEASLEDCRKAVNFVRAVELPVLGVIENMSGFVCPHCGKVTDVFGRGGGEQMAEQMNVPFLGRIPLAAEVVALSDEGQSVFTAEVPVAIKQAFEAIVERLVCDKEESG